MDQQRLQQMDESLAGVQTELEQRLRPRLRELEQQEAAQQRRLSAADADIRNVLADIQNLKDILASVPDGCFNTPPIERP